MGRPTSSSHLPNAQPLTGNACHPCPTRAYGLPRDCRIMLHVPVRRPNPFASLRSQAGTGFPPGCFSLLFYERRSVAVISLTRILRIVEKFYSYRRLHRSSPSPFFVSH